MLFDLSKQALGDQCPSEALTEMRPLFCLPSDKAGNCKKIDIPLALWLRRLPDPIYAAISNFSDYNDDDLTAPADILFNAHNATSRPPIHAITASDPPDTDNLLSTLLTTPSPLHLLSTFHSTRSRTHAPHLRLQKDASFASTSFRGTNFASKLCYYHTHFGSAAKKCQKPCAWPKNAL